MRFLQPLRCHASITRWASMLGIVGMLAACGLSPQTNPQSEQGLPPVTQPAPPVAQPVPPADAPPGTAPILQAKSRWQPVRWADIPGFESDALHEAWNAWIRSCERPAPPWAVLCADVRRLSIADGAQQRAWMRERLQPYRVEPLSVNPGGTTEGLLTSYYEPVFEASRRATPKHSVALWQPPTGLAQRKPWFSRKDIDTLPEAQAALRGREIAYLADPVDALILQIQGSGRLRIAEPDGSQRLVRVAFAGTNDQPYRSVGRWLLDQNLIRDASWPGIKAWIAVNPQRVQEMLWSNPRMVFFREEAIDPAAASQGPRGAQGVALTAGRSIAVDRESIPLGAPVWLQTRGDALNTQRMVIAQDVGSAILGAVRADYYMGSGDAAGELAGRLKQGLQLWVFWPK
ncbi:MltA domain-containing protein [Variovorax sp. PCZ-1]|uniref:murein transglycosylase A n=1 Tax=Variovorax sp. PCZ-1 TaxID=2835533 RepID=UPI0020BDA0CD|nr:MltA domain-containing protein [Variovorax sp. PCZ-1]